MHRLVILLLLASPTGCHEYLVASGAWNGAQRSEMLAARRDDGTEVAIAPAHHERVGSQPQDSAGTTRVRPKTRRRLQIAGAVMIAVGGALAMLGGLLMPGAGVPQCGYTTRPPDCLACLALSPCESARVQAVGGQVMLGFGVAIGAGGVGLLTASAVATPGERPLPGF